MKRKYFVIISFVLTMSLLCIMGFQSRGENSDNEQYPNSEQIVSRFGDGEVKATKKDAVLPFRIDADYEVYTDGTYDYFVDVDNHLVRLIDRQRVLSVTGSPLLNSEIIDIATSLFRKAYGYELTGKIAVVDIRNICDDGNHFRIEVVETIDEIETGNKALMFILGDGTLSKATFLPGTKTANSIARDKSQMISEINAEKIAITAVKNAVNSSDVVIIKSADTPYSANIHTYKENTFWSIEFTANFENESGEKEQATFIVEIDVITSQVLNVYSSLY